MKVCKRCGKEKKLTSFHISETTPDGRAEICSICKSNSKGSGRGRPKSKKVEEAVGWEPTGKILVDLRSGKLHKGEYCSFWNLLISLGYDINGDVHEQFCAKYNLPTKPKPKLPFKLEWCKEDCFNTEQ